VSFSYIASASILEHSSFKSVELRFRQMRVVLVVNDYAILSIPFGSFWVLVRLLNSRLRFFKVTLSLSIAPKASADPASKLLPDNSKCSRPLLKLKLLAISIAFSSEIYFLHIFKCFRTVFCSTIFNKSLT